uniref:MRPL25 domain-containing protein n=1 Tax=Lotharella globosa TaxID=91324 RepID=A0A7S3ZGD6_9EUKA
MSARRVAGRFIRGLKPEYFETYSEEFVQNFMKPRRGKGKAWLRPVLGARQVAELRKETLMSGKAWPYEKEKKPRPLRVVKKSHKHILTEPERKALIEESLKDMDERIEAHKKALRDARPRKRTLYHWLDLAKEEDQLNAEAVKAAGKKK